MRKINNTATYPALGIAPGGAPFYATDILMVQEELWKAQEVFYTQLCGATEGVVIQGLVISNITGPAPGSGTCDLSEGYVFLEGDVLPVAAQYGVAYPFWIKKGTLTEETRTWQDASGHTFMVQQHAEIVFSQPLSGAYIAFNPYTDARLGHVLRRAATPQGEICMITAPGNRFDGTGLGRWEYKGWALCNGQNGTVDLRGRFVVGYHASDIDYDTVGKTGGSKTVTLTEAQMPTHSHGVNDAGHSHSQTAFNALKYQAGSKTVGSGGDWADIGTPGVNTAQTGISLNNSGGGQAHENRPPYYTLAFIQRI